MNVRAKWSGYPSNTYYNEIQICFSRLKGPPPALEGPLAVNTRLQKGHRLFTGKLHGPESFTADEEGERVSYLNFVAKLVYDSQRLSR